MQDMGNTDGNLIVCVLRKCPHHFENQLLGIMRKRSFKEQNNCFQQVWRMSHKRSIFGILDTPEE